MKNWTLAMAVVLAVLFNLSAIQAPSAAEIITIEGPIEAISYRPNMVVVDGTEVYGISFGQLEYYNIFLEVGTVVSIDAYEYVCASGEVKYKAASITVGDVTVTLRTAP